jgi:hypothetical protein
MRYLWVWFDQVGFGLTEDSEGNLYVSESSDILMSTENAVSAYRLHADHSSFLKQDFH